MTAIFAALTFRAAGLWPVSLLALALLGLAVVAFYGPQARALRSPWHWLLPLLRGAALVALAASILRPVVSTEASPSEQGMVLILLDRSMSMGVTDRAAAGASVAQRVRRQQNVGEMIALGEAMGRIPREKRRRAAPVSAGAIDRLASLSEEIRRARREVEYARLSNRDAGEPQRRLDAVVGAFAVAAQSAADEASRRGVRGGVVEQLRRVAQSPGSDEREWYDAARTAIDRLRSDGERSQRILDEQLYREDAEVRRVCDELARLSRLELAWQLLSRGEQPLLRQLQGRTPYAAFSIGQQVAPLDAAPPANNEARDDEALAGDGAPDADQVPSDLTGGLRRALQQVGRQSLQAVVLVSDGRHVGSPPAIPAGLLPSGVPIFAVDAASEGTRDLAAAGVEMPESLFVGEELSVRVNVHSTYPDAAMLAGEATMGLDSGESVRSPLSIKERRVEPIELKATPRTPGLHRVTVTLPVQEGEATTANNRVERWVKVLAQRLRVLAVSGSPGWDYRYMRNALSRAPHVDLREALIVPGSSVLGISPREILDQDVVILADVARDALSLAQWDAISRLVHDRGGSVILVPGVTHLRQQWADHVMADLLPYDPRATKPIWRIWPGESAYYHAVPTREAEALRGLRLDDSPEDSRRRWNELPGFYQYMAIGELKPGTRMLLVERESQAPLLTESRVGNGRVLFMGTSETWRWRYKLGPRVQDRFWLQLVRHAADEPYALVSGRLSADVDRVVVRPGDAVRVRGRLTQRAGDTLPERLSMYVTQEGAYLRGGTLEPVGGSGSGRYAAVIADLTPGQYEVFVSGPTEDGIANDIGLPVRVEPDAEAELADVSGDRTFLQRLADASGGRCIDLAEMPALPAMLAEAREGRPRVREMSLWDSPLLFVFVLSCLAAEWALRKRVGLA
jgi:hypothetical protein